MPRALALLLVLALLLASCGGDIDSDQARLCRQAIPPLNQPGTAIAIVATEAVSVPPRPIILRVRYRATTREGVEIGRLLDCLFAGDGTTLRRGELIGLMSDGARVNEASFYLLRRFHLQDRIDPPVDPGALDGIGLPTLSPRLAYLLQQALSGLPSAAIYALLASAYALIYGLTGRIILAFGEFAALGSLAGVVGVALVLSLAPATPLLGLLVALIVGTAVCALHGFAMGRFALRPLERASGQQMLIATVGLGIALSEYLRLTQGPALRWLPPVFNAPWPVAKAGSFIVTATPIGLLATGLGLALAAALVLYLKHSSYGRAWRASADDPGTAALFGVDSRAVHDRALILAAAACGVAGIIVTAIFGGMGFAGGFTLGLKALVAAVLGGIGSVAGACLGGLAIAVFEIVWSSYLPIEQRDLAVYSLLAIVLVLRPGGFFGERELRPRLV